MKLSAFKVDAAKVEGGQWVRKIPDFPGIGFKARGFTSQVYRKAVASEMEQFTRIERMAGLTPEQNRLIQNKAIADAGILDWSGIEGDDGKPLAFDKALFLEYLMDPDYRRFAEAAAFAMAYVDETASAEAEEAAKN